MPRSKIVTINGKKVTIKEHKVRELREDIIPKLTSLFDMGEITKLETSDVIPLLESKLTEIYPEITAADIEESYPSEIEALIEGWVNINFFGLKKIYKPLMSSLTTVLQLLPSNLPINLDGEQVIGEISPSESLTNY